MISEPSGAATANWNTAFSYHQTGTSLLKKPTAFLHSSVLSKCFSFWNRIYLFLSLLVLEIGITLNYQLFTSWFSKIPSFHLFETYKDKAWMILLATTLYNMSYYVKEDLYYAIRERCSSSLLKILLKAVLGAAFYAFVWTIWTLGWSAIWQPTWKASLNPGENLAIGGALWVILATYITHKFSFFSMGKQLPKYGIVSKSLVTGGICYVIYTIDIICFDYFQNHISSLFAEGSIFLPVVGEYTMQENLYYRILYPYLEKLSYKSSYVWELAHKKIS